MAETVWITKYAMTAGIREVLLLQRVAGDMVKVKWTDRGVNNGEELFFGKDFHDTQEAALARAEEMREAKIRSHEKSIAKLRKLIFAKAEGC